MYVTMQEYFRAKGYELADLPIVRKSATGLLEYIVFKGGVMARLMRKKHPGKNCVWLPDEAKYVNSVIGIPIFSPDSARRLVKESNGLNTILYEDFGDVAVLWVVPSVEKIVNHLHSGIEGQFGLSSYVGYTIMITLKNLGPEKFLVDNNQYPQLTSIKDSPEEFFKQMSIDYKLIEASLNIDFMRYLTNALNYTFLGYDENAQYSLNENNDVIRFSFYCIGCLENVQGKLSKTAERLINDCESARL